MIENSSQCYKTFKSSLMTLWVNKLECLSMVSLYGLVQYLQVRLYNFPSGEPLGALLKGRLSALLANIRLGNKDLSETNTVAYLFETNS